MPPFKGPEWEHVVILGQKGQNYKMECKYCKLKFSGGAPRIREHFIRRNPSVGVAACKADPAEIEDVVAAMAEIDDAQKERAACNKEEAAGQEHSKHVSSIRSSSIYTAENGL